MQHNMTALHPNTHDVASYSGISREGLALPEVMIEIELEAHSARWRAIRTDTCSGSTTITQVVGILTESATISYTLPAWIVSLPASCRKCAACSSDSTRSTSVPVSVTVFPPVSVGTKNE